jgi:hypothetical protein
MKDPTRLGYQNILDQDVGNLRCIGSLRIDKKIQSISSCQTQERICKSLFNDISRKDCHLHVSTGEKQES